MAVVRNVSERKADLEVGGVLFAHGKDVEVDDEWLEPLLSNPNFEQSKAKKAAKSDTAQEG